MKIRLEEVKCKIPYERDEFYRSVEKSFLMLHDSNDVLKSIYKKIPEKFIDESNVIILKKSLDARKKPLLFDVYNVMVFWNEENILTLSDSLFRKNIINKNSEDPNNNNEGVNKNVENLAGSSKGLNKSYESLNNNNNDFNKSYESLNNNNKDFNKSDVSLNNNRPVVVGSGPAGLFAALRLANEGLSPILIERGKSVDERIEDINNFWDNNKFNPLSNVQFGEGGAGTFSDGKLTTGIKNPLCKAVLETFVDGGAPSEILYMTKPHIGTDLLRGIVKNIRNRIISLGGEVLFETKLTNIILDNDKITALEVLYTSPKVNTDKEIIKTNCVILAIGHSARDTIKMLYETGINMQAKPFSMGVRIEHNQSSINESQYGVQPKQIMGSLPAAEYKLSCHLPSGRDVYTFCMCPGGQVIASSSFEGQVVTNGMSLFSRAQNNSNSAVLVNVTPQDFDSHHPLAGIAFQEKWENKAFVEGGQNYFAPVQYVGKFLGKSVIESSNPVIPTYTPGVKWIDIKRCLPEFVATSIKESLPIFDRKLKGFADDGAVITAIESRSSSPVKILRNEILQSNIEGIIPCGEGAGYAGGIMSAAVDGIKCADAALEFIKIFDSKMV